jgi:arsenite methyltransferase
MSKLKFLPPILAEICLPRQVQRQPEPDLVMDREDQVTAYQEAGDNAGGMFAVHLFHAAHMSQTIYGARSVIDLACGPGALLMLMAQIHPTIRFIGVDLSAPMLEAAESSRQARGLENVTFVQQDITKLDLASLGKFDAVTSTMAAHHLPTVGHLERFFAQVQTIAENSGRVYIADLLRPKRQRTLDFMVRSSLDVQSTTFSEDYRNSMAAAFVGSDFRRLQNQYLPYCKYNTTFPAKLFMILKSQSRQIPNALRHVFVEERSNLSPRLRQDLDDLRTFFALGGLKPDAFA